MSSSSYLSDVLQDHSIDFCEISEHWLFNKDLHFLDKINNGYKSYAVSDKDLLLPVYCKVDKGGGGRGGGRGCRHFCGIEIITTVSQL